MIKNKKLQQKILKMAEEDQKLRNLAIKNIRDKRMARRVYDCDKKNIVEEKKIIEKYGWPTFDLVGKEASNSFWLLIQHADQDIKFQIKCLKILEKAVKEKQANPKNFAYLTDRILIAQKKKQKFGTQFLIKDNKLILRPVANVKNLNKRRAAYGLNKIKEQIKEMNKRYSVLQKK